MLMWRREERGKEREEKKAISGLTIMSGLID